MGRKEGKKDALTKLMRKEEKRKKQETKTEKNLKKQERRELQGEEDLQAKLAKWEAEEAAKVKNQQVVLQSCDAPSPRVSFSIVVAPSGEIVMFGGEYYDGANQYVYNETFRWNVEKDEWRQVFTPKAPKPRCAHQAVVHKHHMYVFGGEYSTLSQFHHYRDLWRFDLKTNTWEELQTTGQAPSQRSGHRMAVWKNFIVLFGGFYDTFRDCKYFNDLYLLNVAELKWSKFEFGTSDMAPSPRGGCCLAVHPSNDTMFVFGGYSRENKQNATQGTEHSDLWMLHLKSGKLSWERLSKKGTAPSKRSGASMVVHKNRALVFGGVCDKEMPGMALDSQFFNELYAFDMDRKRWYVLEYKLPQGKSKGRKRRAVNDATTCCTKNEGGRGIEEEVEEEGGGFEWTFEYVDESGNVQHLVIENENDSQEGSPKNEEEREGKEEPKSAEEFEKAPMVRSAVMEAFGLSAGGVVIPEKKEEEEEAPLLVSEIEENKRRFQKYAQMSLEMPPPRIKAQMVVKGNSLVLYGGMKEERKGRRDKEVTYDDCWTLDLNKRDKWQRVLEGTMDQQEWLGSESESGGSDLDEDDFSDLSDSEGEEEEEEEGEGEEVKEKKEKKKKKEKKQVDEEDEDDMGIRQKMKQIQEAHPDLGDLESTPQTGEALKDFFKRTQAHWMTVFERQLQEEAVEGEEPEILDMKEIRQRVFMLAKERFDSLRSVLAELEELEQEQAEMEAKFLKDKDKKDKKEKKEKKEKKVKKEK